MVYCGQIDKGGEKMKTIGLIGGMSFESTVTYYQLINEEVRDRLGGLHSAKCIVYSVDFHEIEACQKAGDWERSAQILGNAAQSLEKAGADIILICTNTMHKVAPQVQRAISVPLLHVGGATVRTLQREGITKVGLLGTKYTMQQDFYKEVLVQEGIDVLIPDEEDMATVNDVIFKELCLGNIREGSRNAFLAIMEKLRQRGAEGVILGCTEIGLLVKEKDTDIPLFDTTVIHALEAVNWALA